MRHDVVELRTSDGLRLYGQCWTPDAEPGTVVCLVHGFGEHSGRYAHVADYLTTSGYALLALDLRGHGRSEGRRGHSHSWDALLDDVGGQIAEARRRFPSLPAFLYGHSFGGLTVLSFALRRRPSLSGIIATGPLLRQPVEVPAWKRGLARLAAGTLPTLSFGDGVDPATLSRDPEVGRAYAADPLVHDTISARLGRDVMDEGAWALAHAAEFALPLLLMHGGEDRITSFEASQAFATRVPGDCTFRPWPGLYHEIHNEPERQEVLAELVAWLSAHTRAETGTGCQPTSGGTGTASGSSRA